MTATSTGAVPQLTTPSGDPWDLLVIGGGTAGIVAAGTAARFGARVLLVERARTGGDCLWTGCVPSKALLAAAGAAHRARTAARLGVDTGSVTVDFAQVMAHVHETVASIAPVDSVASLQVRGVSVATAEAVLTGPGTALVGDRPVTFTQALLATGAHPTVPDLPGLDRVDHLTSDTVWDLTELPGRLVVLGGGSIGCELGQAFARLGSQVTLVEGADRVLPQEDADAGALVHAALQDDGVHVRVGSAATSVAAGHVLLDDGSRVEFDRLLVAVGRTPRTAGLGLTDAGVQTTGRGTVVVDDHLRTTNPRIWAAGDLTGHPQFTHVAGVHGSLAAGNAVLGLRRRVGPDRGPPGHLHRSGGRRRGGRDDRRGSHRRPRGHRPRRHRGRHHRLHPVVPGPPGTDRGRHRGGAAGRGDPGRADPGGLAGAAHPGPGGCHPRLPDLERRGLERRHRARPRSAGSTRGVHRAAAGEPDPVPLAAPVSGAVPTGQRSAR